MGIDGNLPEPAQEQATGSWRDGVLEGQLRERERWLAQEQAEPFSSNAIGISAAAWKMGYEARKAEEQPEPVQEPVAWECKAGGLKALTQRQYDAQTAATKRHYTRIAPPQRPRLTDEEIDTATAQERDALLDHIYEYGTAAEGVLERIRKLCRAVERAHGIGDCEGAKS